MRSHRRTSRKCDEYPDHLRVFDHRREVRKTNAVQAGSSRLSQLAGQGTVVGGIVEAQVGDEAMET